ncbi:unnamed protein product [Cyprideis torosa]|uniref:Uncharacterized protein n=1 Tax=Cyprideis torosa TaxID=163714 RepID=A0A7R8W540_9CRUS|nr:unnamed protein product [Cyprideis torosa]CAG0880203.1 unnamed protein product [Cyprideis torosa]
MHSLLFGFFVALASVATSDRALDLSSNDRRTIPIYNGQCDNPFTPVEGSLCYFLSYDQMETDWLSAQMVCSWLHPNGRLAEFETSEELVHATLFLLNDNGNGTSPWAAPGPWIGAIELGDSNEFVWASSNSPIEATNWSPSRPNSPTFGDGVALDASNSFEWINLSNATEAPILCEIPSNPLDVLCPEGFFSLGDSCYAVYDEYPNKLPWDEAQSFCGSLAAGGRLVELENAEEINRLKDHLMESDYYCESYWIGGEEVGDTSTFVWASTGQMIGDSDWLPGEPNNSGSGDAIFLWCPANWQWYDYSKTYPHNPICEAPPIAV